MEKRGEGKESGRQVRYIITTPFFFPAMPSFISEEITNFPQTSLNKPFRRTHYYSLAGTYGLRNAAFWFTHSSVSAP